MLEIVREKRLALSWTEEGAGWAEPARLTITLKTTATGTEVSLTHDGFEAIGSPDWPRIVRAYERGVDAHHLLGKLAAAVHERG